MANINSLTDNAKNLGLLVIIVAVVLAILQGFTTSGALLGSNTSVNTVANQTVATGVTEIGGLVSDWLGIIVLIIIGGFLMSMKIFGNK